MQGSERKSATVLSTPAMWEGAMPMRDRRRNSAKRRSKFCPTVELVDIFRHHMTAEVLSHEMEATGCGGN